MDPSLEAIPDKVRYNPVSRKTDMAGVNCPSDCQSKPPPDCINSTVRAHILFSNAKSTSSCHRVPFFFSLLGVNHKKLLASAFQRLGNVASSNHFTLVNWYDGEIIFQLKSLPASDVSIIAHGMPKTVNKTKLKCNFHLPVC